MFGFVASAVGGCYLLPMMNFHSRTRPMRDEVDDNVKPQAPAAV